jgi:predicted transcriptional regulator
MRTKHTFRLPPELATNLAHFATRKRVPQALVVETALASYLSPDGSERLEAALGRRLDRLSRQMDRMERHVTITNEALALFVRFWLTTRLLSPTPRRLPPRPKAKSVTRGTLKPWRAASPRDKPSRKKFPTTWIASTNQSAMINLRSRTALAKFMSTDRVFLRARRAKPGLLRTTICPSGAHWVLVLDVFAPSWHALSQGSKAAGAQDCHLIAAIPH